MKEVNKREERCGYTQQQTSATDLQLTSVTINSTPNSIAAEVNHPASILQARRHQPGTSPRPHTHHPPSIVYSYGIIAPPTLGTIDPEA